MKFSSCESLPRYELSRAGGIDHKISGQCDCGDIAFESLKIKTILEAQFEVVLRRSL
jgi:hypothetical protein